MALPIIDLTSATVRPVDISTDSNRYGWMGKGDFGGFVGSVKYDLFHMK
jgi:outer membrane lipoprotein SlyB